MSDGSSALPANVAQSPEWLAQALDLKTGLVRLVQMDAAAYRAASFLDDRMFQQTVQTMICEWNDLVSLAASMTRDDARWIFHIGHVGSTLVSRLLGELTGVLGIREPRILRDLTQLHRSELAIASSSINRLLSRTFAPSQSAVVKATSFVSELAPWLCPSNGRALFLFASPRQYICTILAGENSRKELVNLAPIRAARMAHRVRSMSDVERSNAHLAAAAWACEMTSLEQALEKMPDRTITWINFDSMLADMPGNLGAAAAALDLPCKMENATEITRGPLMGRYSKAPEYEYTPALRSDLIDEAGHAHRAAIEAAMIMLQKASVKSPLLTRALARNH